MSEQVNKVDALAAAKVACEAIEERHGENIVLIDVRETSVVTDYYLVVSGSSAPHLKALSRHVQGALKDAGVQTYRKAGDPESGWQVVDCMDLVIHIFSPSAREYYAIEDLWKESPRVQ